MKIALIGNPNSGKTSLFNKLTGQNQKIGNWPGVTVEKKEGIIFNTDFTLVDLPGIYSLFPYSAEEQVSRDFLLNENPDLVINIIDSTSLERSLYLTTQLFDLGVDVILVLNMTDLLAKRGVILDEEKLSKNLKIHVVKTSAKTGEGIDKLIEVLKTKKTQTEKQKIEIYPQIIEKEINNVKNSMNLKNKFLALEIIQNCCVENNYSILRSKTVIEKFYKSDFEQVIANERYNFISKVRDDCLSYCNQKESITDKIDKIVLNKWLALPIFVFLMSFVYVFSVGIVGGVTSEFMKNLFSNFGCKVSEFLIMSGASVWAVSLVVDGIITGIGSVLSFVPQLLVIFICISILETTGYMSRISLMFDRLFRLFGLSGKSLVPFIVGTGCSVPAISSTKTIENNQEREMTVVLTPFVPCSAKLPIIALFIGYFFPNNTGLITAFIYFFAVIVIMLCALILKKICYKNQTTSFISELPEYKLPSIKYVTRDVFDKLKDFILRAGTVILFCSVVVWFLSSFNWKFQYCNDIQKSILAGIGNLFAWFFYPIVGEWNWAVSVSAIQGIIAKEQVVSSMSIIAGLSESTSVSSVFSAEIFSCFNNINSLAFVVFNLFSAPCVASIVSMKNELKSTKKMIFAIMFQILFAWSCACLINLVGSLFI